MNGGIVTYTMSTLLTQPIKPVTGFIGAFNFGGTKTDILKATPSCATAQDCYSIQSGDPTFVDWGSFYFVPGLTRAYHGLPWALTYTLVTGVGPVTKAGYGDLWVETNSGSFGDIVT
jgi:hypothetical protein